MSQLSVPQDSTKGLVNNLLESVQSLAKCDGKDDAKLCEILELFLEQLGSIFEGNDSNIFAKVAMIVQSSTTAYSKMVELLYDLVLEMVDLLKSKGKTQINKEKAQTEKKSKFEFTPLDDIEVSKNITLKEDGVPSKRRSAVIKFLPKTPVTLIPLDELEKGDIMLKGPKGEDFGNIHDYNMLNWIQSESGKLFQDLSMLILAEKLQRRTNNRNHLDCINMSEADHIPLFNLDEQSSLTDNVGDFPNDFDNLMNDNDDDDDNDNDENSNNECQNSKLGSPMKQNGFPVESRPILQESKNKFYPWVFCNSHKVLAVLSKTLQKGRVIKVPEKFDNSFQTKNSKKYKKKLKQTKLDVPTVFQFCSQTFYSNASKMPKNINKLSQDPDLEDGCFNEFKIRQEKFRSIKKAKAPTIENNFIKPADEPMDSSCRLEEDIANDNDGCGESCIGGADDNNSFFDDGMSIGNVSDGALSMASLESAVSVGYGELVKNHVAKYFENAKKYVQVTDLGRRVREWEDRILPKLEKEEEHVSYDIHQYGTQVLDHFGDNTRKQTLTFTSIMTGKEPFEVARLFLATLQLANNYNVEITANNESGEECGSGELIELTLLSRKQHYAELELKD